MEISQLFLSIGAQIILDLESGKSSIDEDTHAKILGLLSDLLNKSPEEQLCLLINALNILSENSFLRTKNLNRFGVPKSGFQSENLERLRDLLIESPHNRRQKQLFVCPIDPTHYRKRVVSASTALRCPLHDIDLVRDESSSPILG